MNRKPQNLIRIAELGIWQFFILTIIAMFIYPGGTLHDATLESYSFLNNFFSDLGRTQDFEGNVNPARWVFTVTVTLVGLAMAAFFYALPAIFKRDDRFGVSKYITVFFGLIAGLCYIGVAFTPYDIRFSGHEYSVKIGFSAFLIMSVILTWMIYKSKYYPNIYGHIFIIFDLILLFYVYLLFFGPDARESYNAMVLQVVSQKIVVYSEIICMVIQMRGARRILDA
ncbi:MAG: DUF998 domain-containing protein [Bacteroidetes bacterium]|nr:DUF998 domain-containing protein [Bacteroidota bacterium]